MLKLCVALLLTAGAASLQAQPTAAMVPIQPSIDSPAERQALRKLTLCLAQARPNWARTTLSYPYLSDRQASIASQALVGRDNCLLAPETEITFRNSGLVGSLAEYYVRKGVSDLDWTRLAAALSTTAPLNASEDFALCVAARNPGAARDLALSEPGSSAENDAARALSAQIAPCMNPGERLTIDLQSLRALVSTALYRGVTSIQPAGN